MFCASVLVACFEPSLLLNGRLVQRKVWIYWIFIVRNVGQWPNLRTCDVSGLYRKTHFCQKVESLGSHGPPNVKQFAKRSPHANLQTSRQSWHHPFESVTLTRWLIICLVIDELATEPLRCAAFIPLFSQSCSSCTPYTFTAIEPLEQSGFKKTVLAVFTARCTLCKRYW